jgi:glycosyltransferase involved in cell wall biosynthesis
LTGEVIVADNGSQDDSVALAQAAGARVVLIAERGYGRALMGGIAAAEGEFIIMGDADGSYDFGEIPNFVTRLREGFDVVQGCRLPAGGGKIDAGAMPWLHRWVGNPLLTVLARWMFRVPVHDIYCGLRGFRKSAYLRLNQRCTGMEFATEMIIKAALFQLRITEIPITLQVDGRRTHAPHLRTFRDGWRTVRFFLLHSPRWLFLVPGWILLSLGLLGFLVAMPGLKIYGLHFDAHTLLFSSLAMLCGYQAVVFAFLTKGFAVNEGLVPTDENMLRWLARVNVNTGLVAGLFLMVVGTGLLLGALGQWRAVQYGALDYAYTMRWVIPGVTLASLGFQTVLASFFFGILALKRL